MGFATDITPDEAALGFERVEHVAHGSMVVARVGNGLRAVKLRDSNGVRYVICDDAMIMLYEPAQSLFDLRRRFGLGDHRRAG